MSSIQQPNSNSPQSRETTMSGLPSAVPLSAPPTTVNWKDRAVQFLDGTKVRLNDVLPNWIVQNKADELGSYIKNKFSCFKEFNAWLREEEQGAWYKQLAMYLVKLPLRSAMNIINLLFSIIEAILKAAVHPLESLVELAKFIVALAHSLTQAETYCKIGTGMIGAGLGQALVLNAPVSLLSMLIGSALLIGGLSVGALQAAVNAQKGQKKQAVGQFFKRQMHQAPESLVTGFMIGLLIGGIRKAVESRQQGSSQKVTSKATSLEEATALAKKFAEANHLDGASYTVTFDPATGDVIMKFGPQFSDLAPYLPKEYTQGGDTLIISEAKIVLNTNGTGYVLIDEYAYGDHGWVSWDLNAFRLKPI